MTNRAVYLQSGGEKRCISRIELNSALSSRPPYSSRIFTTFHSMVCVRGSEADSTQPILSVPLISHPVERVITTQKPNFCPPPHLRDDLVPVKVGGTQIDG